MCVTVGCEPEQTVREQRTWEGRKVAPHPPLGGLLAIAGITPFWLKKLAQGDAGRPGAALALQEPLKIDLESPHVKRVEGMGGRNATYSRERRRWMDLWGCGARARHHHRGRLRLEERPSSSRSTGRPTWRPAAVRVLTSTTTAAARAAREQ